MKFWQALSFTDPTHLVALARKAEEVGFEGVLLADHLFFPGRLRSRYPYASDGAPPFGADTPFPEPWCAISALAAATSRLRFSIGIYILPLHDPLEVARASATASVLSGGRVALGAGVGWMREEFEVQGIDFATRGARCDEAIGVLRKLWTGRVVEHRGEHFAFPPLSIAPAPPAPIPIWVGGASPRALRRAARLGDGWLGSGQAPDEAARLLGELARLRREAGRAGEPFEAIGPLAAPPDAALFARLAERGMTGTVSWPPSLSLGRPHPSLEEEYAQLERYGEGVIRRLGRAPGGA
jgi:probable F420-dependent oxidoreductase